MVKIYITSGCLGCRQTIKFFEENNIEYAKKDISKTKLTKNELLDILSLSENGFGDIISIRSKEYQKKKNTIEDLKTNELIDLIISYPQILSRPISVQYVNNKPLRMLIGYNSNDIEIFLRNDGNKKTTIHEGSCGFEEKCSENCNRKEQWKITK